MSTFYDYQPYPDIYYMISPKVKSYIEDYSSSIEITQDISQSEIESMIDEVYGIILEDYPEIANDIQALDEEVDSQIVPIRRRRLFRDIVTIIFLDELFRHRRRRRRRHRRRHSHHSFHDNPYYGYSYYEPGYWY